MQLAAGLGPPRGQIRCLLNGHPKTCTACSIQEDGNFKGNLSKAWEGRNPQLSASEVLHKSILIFLRNQGGGFICKHVDLSSKPSTNVRPRHSCMCL